MKLKLFFTGLFIFLIFQVNFAQTTTQQYRLLKTIPVEGDGFWDYLITDPSHTRLFISHGTCVQVMDLKTEKIIATIPNTPGVHGIALVPEFGKGFISAGRIDSVIIFDLMTYNIIGKVKTGKNPDAIIYDPFSKRVFSFDAGGNDVTAIDAKTNVVVGQIPFPGNPENAVPDGNGKMFVNIEDTGMIIKFDTKTLKIVAQWSLAPGKGPTGLAFDRTNRLLFSGCSESKQLVVLDANKGTVITTLPIGDRCDGVAYSDKEQNVVTSNGDGTMTVIHQSGPNHYSVIQTLETKKSARTITYDFTLQKFFLSAADVTMENGKRKVTPGSFCIVVVGK
jgi:YVTN family beta-propeller protein